MTQEEQVIKILIELRELIKIEIPEGVEFIFITKINKNLLWTTTVGRKETIEILSECLKRITWMGEDAKSDQKRNPEHTK